MFYKRDRAALGHMFCCPGLLRRAVRTMENDPYTTAKEVGYTWEKGGCRNSLKAAIGESMGVPDENLHGEFIIEHYWGYTQRGETRVDEYRVEHPKWELFLVEDVTIDVDFGRTYGENSRFWRGRSRIRFYWPRGRR